MKKILIGVSGILIVVAIGFYVFNSFIYTEKQATSAPDYKDIEYTIEGAQVHLVDGVSETVIVPNSASKITTRYFGNEVWKDLNADGSEDVVFLLTQESGGSGTFFYVVAALTTSTGYIGSEALLLGDRIAPQTTESGPGNSVIINYADRATGEGFDVRPSVGKSLRLILNPGTMQFGEIAQNFEGEADPTRMKLTMKTWRWVNTKLADQSTVVPRSGTEFTLTFSDRGTFSAKTDCNSGGGTYTADVRALTFGNIASTLMYCEGSEETEFSQFLQDTVAYDFSSKGELILQLKGNSGSVIFR